ncbi:MAG: hypothetical protein E7566_04530 [Ruminococcaceae bacterium]|nr:hypothetical protein [Oscillospiraceae bacterium]
MTKERALKKQARKHLQGNLPAAVGATLTVMVAIMTCIYLPSIVYSLLVNALIITGAPIPNVPYVTVWLLIFAILICISAFLPLIAGYLRFCYLLSKNNYCDYSEVFCYFSKGKYFSTIALCLMLIAKSIWQAVISFLPFALLLLKAISNSTGKDNLAFGDFMWYYISYALLFAGIMFFYMLTKHNFLAIYYYIEYDYLKASDVCNLSRKTAVRFGKDINKLNFSLLPKMLLCILIIPSVFVLPYIFVTKATAAKWMIALSNKDEA